MLEIIKYKSTVSCFFNILFLPAVFGIGSMIYSGLEVGQYFELQADDSCADILLVISPAARMLFTFIQMYFIFLNTRVWKQESEMGKTLSFPFSLD